MVGCLDDNVEIQTSVFDGPARHDGLCVMINSAFLCVPDLVEKFLALNQESLYDHGVQVASCVDTSAADAKEVEINGKVGWKMLSRPWKFLNGQESN